MPQAMKIKVARRHAIPMIMSLSGVSGSGKTYSALLLAAGLAGPGGKVGFIDTEYGRGCMYADSPGIVKALPNGYSVIDLEPPFHPNRYSEAIDAFENEKFDVVIIDSGSHSWEGEGGCTDIAEEDKGRWNNAKLWNKRLVNRLLSSSMHIIVCLRAREKSKIIAKKDSPDGKEHIISLGIQPICEKNFVFEMLLSLMVDETTKNATPIKCPEPLEPLFLTPHRITKLDGERIRQWNDTGAAVEDPNERLYRRARAAAEEGTAGYRIFFESLSKADKNALKPIHDELKHQAADAEQRLRESSTEPTDGGLTASEERDRVLGLRLRDARAQLLSAKGSFAGEKQYNEIIEKLGVTVKATPENVERALVEIELALGAPQRDDGEMTMAKKA